MNKYTAWYCYDAWCGWCYGFSSVIKKAAAEFAPLMNFEVLSGGMILPETPGHIGLMAGYIEKNYPRVEELTGAVFGADYLWHIRNPDKSDWFPSSEKPAIALAVFKEYYPEQQVAFAGSLQHALFYEGRDLTDNEAYRHLLHEYHLPELEFYEKLASDTYRDKAHEEFALCKQLRVTGYPALFIQTGETRFYQAAAGYTSYENLHQTIENILKTEKNG